ncbi:acyl-CoA/acyl-ACP dehydrogenase [Diaphorobacter sp. HDW4A]|uniref:acyl-CoA dehydrogenase family protein n=1 Tax=Diaphorobacter sp. HDW4A TaxID=2714924 RepID=UPI00140A0D43|nr:acyl-CoA dehydrogenase family protein [Diaphorobacter sp. HDW4A]QIL82624.1 acyl-CoA/acyl-ACP dehydrogenase [Diaphorobacter sp. HDW4A]
MSFELTTEQQAIREAVQDLCTRFPESYWLERDADGVFPHDFYRAMGDAGWLGTALPEEYGGAGLGVQEACVLMQTIAESGACMSGASSIHINIFGLMPVVVYGTDEQKRRMLPPIARGEVKACFGVTEPNAGLNTTKLKTRAVRQGDKYVVHGQKVWISTAQVADKILLLARTTALEDLAPGQQSHGLTLFYTDLDRSKIDVRLIEKMGRKCVDSNELFIDGLEIPVEDRIGEEGKGFKYILHGMNPERILLASEAIGVGRAALAKASNYARERVVFDRPIGKNQSIQHPLAKNWIELEAAQLLMMKAGWLYDNGRECGAEANAAKYFAAEAGFKACEQAILTHGGMGYSKEFHVERYLREIMIPRIAPVSRELILSHIAERVLGMPKSY